MSELSLYSITKSFNDLMLSDEITDEEKSILNAILTNLSDSLVEQTKTVESLTPETKKAWETLAKGNYDV